MTMMTVVFVVVAVACQVVFDDSGDCSSDDVVIIDVAVSRGDGVGSCSGNDGGICRDDVVICWGDCAYSEHHHHEWGAYFV